ncbi:hypothetical protein EJ02DRAFT_449402 [Clathrospora elynae]|uniref:Uncharacterized protein n=1 Tax=Clathrospora elynae TaxID=706981 RepID=A0A6A5T809_9PLEO|nr:hypothetical protein EJ02DRAFT_449402 [Clathrospora elynae]
MESMESKWRGGDWFVDDFTENEDSDINGDDDEPSQASGKQSSHGPPNCAMISNSQYFSVSQDNGAVSQLSPEQDLTKLASPDDHRRMLFVTELIQNIFARLLFRDQVISTGVCKTWRQILRQETPTAFYMFLKPMLKAPFTPIIFPENRQLPNWRLEKMRKKWHHSLNTQDWCQKERCVTLRPHRIVDEEFVHPIFHELAINGETCLRVNGHSASFTFITAASISRFLNLHKHSAPEASWRKMLLTNPPAKRFWAYSELPGDVVENEDGIELGQVARYISEMMEREESRGGEWKDQSRREMVERMLGEERKKMESLSE